MAHDGPRPDHPDDTELTQQTRQIVRDGVTWDCDLRTLNRDENLGVRRGVVEAIDWFFSQETEGIILEDDCLPHPDFFSYCSELLERYREDDRVWAIQGDKPEEVKLNGLASYGFIPYALVWGWATWKRAWDHYDRDLSNWRRIRETSEVKKLFPDRIERRIRTQHLDRLLHDPDYTWDYQWAFTLSYHGGLATVPRVNLVSNIGWGRSDASHTSGPSRRHAASTSAILPLTHPNTVTKDRGASVAVLNGPVFGAGRYRAGNRLGKFVRKGIRALPWRPRGGNSRKHGAPRHLEAEGE